MVGEIIRLEELDKEKIRKVARYITEGKIAIIPTDTVYGLATNPFIEASVKRIYEVKRRGKKPIPLLVSSVQKVEELAIVNSQAKVLMRRFWPGALTIILHKKPIVSSLITANEPTVGVRMPDHKIALAIIEKAGAVVTGTSANISGEPPPSSLSEISMDVLKQVDIVVDSGKSLGIPSTIIDLTKDPPVILRKGALDTNLILSVIKQ
ncbi:MAG TPA: threonylcarbamoyl-AMP synthase [Thermofilum sp.]|nr:threonylcarbamoyl-AMP synthase [Thermofilum sp.]